MPRAREGLDSTLHGSKRSRRADWLSLGTGQDPAAVSMLDP
ncbi:hypothetical protein ACFFX0_16480 [Citricoccus parietis]|uniref:Uncharacterized protein n=1 Tax=Citricoccus parietis TaxID=592307 RepID=A0ABV5G196_9MICC